jgi:hypothetical protein
MLVLELERPPEMSIVDVRGDYYGSSGGWGLFKIIRRTGTGWNRDSSGLELESSSSFDPVRA